MVKFFILILLLTFFSPQKSLAFQLNPIYMSGKEICNKYSSHHQSEFAKYVNVPLDYSDPNSPQISIYTYLKKPFNSNWPSVFFFTGGPGVSSRSTEFNIPEINVIFMEQRGISCSRPERESLYLDPSFYSSLNTARDARLVIDSYGIKKLAIYGHSYGTMPATIFSSLFKEMTTSLILEGVVYQADDDLWTSEKKKKLLQRLFDQSKTNIQEKILYWSNHKEVPKNWFSKIGHFMLYLDDGINVYEQFLENVMQMPEENFIPFVKNFYSNPQALEETYSFGSVTFAMIACQEMSMAKENLSMNYIFSPENQLISDFFNEDDEQNCKTINIKHDQDRIYKANQFKVDVPVYYLLGENDGATSLVQGLKHAKNVALNRKQVFILEKGGHLPLLGHLKEYREDNNDTIK